MRETKEDVLNEMKRTFKRDYEKINGRFNMLYEGKSIEGASVSIERFRQAGIDAINKLYEK
ncbi:MAG: hypothetical protein SOU27_00055 [Sodaliphilus sp.]|nr:hypothetical protein [Sodaliphilus sp.]